MLLVTEMRNGKVTIDKIDSSFKSKDYMLFTKRIRTDIQLINDDGSDSLFARYNRPIGVKVDGVSYLFSSFHDYYYYGIKAQETTSSIKNGKVIINDLSSLSLSSDDFFEKSGGFPTSSFEIIATSTFLVCLYSKTQYSVGSCTLTADQSFMDNIISDHPSPILSKLNEKSRRASFFMKEASINPMDLVHLGDDKILYTVDEGSPISSYCQDGVKTVHLNSDLTRDAIAGFLDIAPVLFKRPTSRADALKIWEILQATGYRELEPARNKLVLKWNTTTMASAANSIRNKILAGREIIPDGLPTVAKAVSLSGGEDEFILESNYLDYSEDVDPIPIVNSERQEGSGLFVGDLEQCVRSNFKSELYEVSDLSSYVTQVNSITSKIEDEVETLKEETRKEVNKLSNLKGVIYYDVSQCTADLLACVTHEDVVKWADRYNFLSDDGDLIVKEKVSSLMKELSAFEDNLLNQIKLTLGGFDGRPETVMPFLIQNLSLFYPHGSRIELPGQGLNSDPSRNPEGNESLQNLLRDVKYNYHNVLQQVSSPFKEFRNPSKVFFGIDEDVAAKRDGEACLNREEYYVQVPSTSLIEARVRYTLPIKWQIRNFLSSMNCSYWWVNTDGKQNYYEWALSKVFKNLFDNIIFPVSVIVNGTAIEARCSVVRSSVSSWIPNYHYNVSYEEPITVRAVSDSSICAKGFLKIDLPATVISLSPRELSLDQATIRDYSLSLSRKAVECAFASLLTANSMLPDDPSTFVCGKCNYTFHSIPGNPLFTKLASSYSQVVPIIKTLFTEQFGVRWPLSGLYDDLIYLRGQLLQKTDGFFSEGYAELNSLGNDDLSSIFSVSENYLKSGQLASLKYWVKADGKKYFFRNDIFGQLMICVLVFSLFDTNVSKSIRTLDVSSLNTSYSEGTKEFWAGIEACLTL